jgi:hypothetical protein
MIPFRAVCVCVCLKFTVNRRKESFLKKHFVGGRNLIGYAETINCIKYEACFLLEMTLLRQTADQEMFGLASLFTFHSSQA